MLLAALALVAAPAAQPTSSDLIAEIRAADKAIFDLVFGGCDPAALRRLIADDVEFYHDKGGLVFRSGADWQADYSKKCAEQRKPDAWKSRRELIPGSLLIDPVPGFGAMEVGEHLFYERKGDGPEKLVGRAGFAMVWAKTPDGWKLKRVLSYGHRSAP